MAPAALQGVSGAPSGGLVKALVLSVALHAGVLGAVSFDGTSASAGARSATMAVSLTRAPEFSALKPVRTAERQHAIAAPAATPAIAPPRSAPVTADRRAVVAIVAATSALAVTRAARAVPAPRVKAQRLRPSVPQGKRSHERTAGRTTSRRSDDPPARARGTTATPAGRPATPSIDTHSDRLAKSRAAANAGAVVTAARTPSANASASDRRGVSRAPRPVTDNAPPLYPRLARRRGLEGRVVLALEVSPDGRARGAVVVESSGVEMLDDAAREAVSRWRFEPALERGRAVPATVKVPVVFRLDRRG